MKKIAALLLFPMLAHAQAGQMTQYLTRERATLLDVGMMRLETLTTAFESRVGVHWTENGAPKFFRPSINSSFEPDDEKFYVYFLVMDSMPTEQQMAEGCDNAMTQMSTWLLKSLPKLFLHTGYDDASMPPGTSKALSDMFELRCYFSSERDSSEGRFWASRRLTDREMTIGKWKMRS
jgi:hypothetical protein